MNPRFMRNGLLMLVLVMGVSALLYTWLGAAGRPRSLTRVPARSSSEVEQGNVGKVVQSGETLSVFDKPARTPQGTTEPDYTVTVANVLTQVQQDIAAAAERGGRPTRPSIPSRPRTTPGSGWCSPGCCRS